MNQSPRLLLLLIICFVASYLIRAQETKAYNDSINQLIAAQEKKDTTLVKHYFALAENNYLQDYNTAITACEKAKEISLQINYDKGIQDSYGWLAYLYDQKGDPATALNYQLKAIEILKDSDSKAEYSTALNNAGNIYYKLGDVELSIDYFLRALKIEEMLGNKSGLGIAYNNLGFLYQNQKDYEKAIKYFRKALSLYIEEKDRKEEGVLYNNIGALYSKQNKLDSAKYYFKKAVHISEEIENLVGLANSNSNLGQVYAKENKFAKAMEYYQSSYKIRKELGEKEGIVSSLINIAGIYIKKKDYRKSKELLEEARVLAEELGYPEKLSSVYKVLSEVYYELGDGLKAADLYKLHVEMKDSVFNASTQKASIQKELQYEFQKKTIKDSLEHLKEKEIKDARIAKQEAELKFKQNQQIGFAIGILVLLIFIVFVINRYRHSLKQNKIIEEQRELTEEQKNILQVKNREILDSINYALRIQNAILPELEEVKNNFKECFILFKPKDVVSGDFYWFEKQNNDLYIAAADCTGHGVPGAMISVICSTALSKSLLEEKITNTSEILNRTREILIEHFQKGSSQIQDGMDISLCKISGNQLQWSGANNPLWIIRNEELIAIKPDKQPIGVVDNPKPFSTHQVELQKGDCIYLFTDGFQDQFGGEKGKKFKPAKLKKLLLSVHHEPMDKQYVRINESFENWKGNLEQLDDVCLIGVKV